MKMLKNLPLLTCFAMALGAFAQSPADKLMQEGRQSPTLEKNLRALTDEIGGRVPGTPAMRRAIQWGVNAFKAAGADSVHTEPVRMAASWSEGNTRVSVISPVQFQVRAVSLTWTAPSFSPPQGARVIDIGFGSPAEIQKAGHGNLRGAILLVHSNVMKAWEDLLDEYFRQLPLLAAARQAGAAAIAFISTREHDLLYRHIGSFDDHINHFPQILLAREDGERIARLLAEGQPVQMRYSIPNRVGGPIVSQNVVAEIRGREKPNEYVVLGAHLDSWALGTGALDNGCNAALVIEALRSIKAAGLQPRRAIRFVLFTGEEEGTLGSLAYVRAHRGELDNIDAMLTWDSGTGRTTGFSLGGRKDLVESVAALSAPLKQFDAATLTTDASVGTDNLDFLLEGVPTLVANQEESNYLVNYHASSDTFDKVDLAQLRKHVAEAAYLAFAIADSPQRLGPRQSRVEIESLIKETHLDDQLKGFDAWNDWENGKRGRAKK